MIQLIGIGLHGRVFAISNLKKIISGKTKLRIEEYQENCWQLICFALNFCTDSAS